MLFVFQPAEEVSTGAEAIIETGAFEKYSPVAFLSLHVMPDIPAGKVGVREGPIMAAQGGFSVEIQGKGGHGAAPHTTQDPLIAAVQIAEALPPAGSIRQTPLSFLCARCTAVLPLILSRTPPSLWALTAT